MTWLDLIKDTSRLFTFFLSLTRDMKGCRGTQCPMVPQNSTYIPKSMLFFSLCLLSSNYIHTFRATTCFHPPPSSCLFSPILLLLVHYDRGGWHHYSLHKLLVSYNLKIWPCLIEVSGNKQLTRRRVGVAWNFNLILNLYFPWHLRRQFSPSSFSYQVLCGIREYWGHSHLKHQVYWYWPLVESK